MEQFPSSSPFYSFKISDQEALRKAESEPRSVCITCNRSVKYFCYRCIRMVGSLEGDSIIPQVELPINMKMYKKKCIQIFCYYLYLFKCIIYIFSLKHEQELDSKSTAIHAKLLSPSQISIHQFHRSAASFLNESQSYSMCSSDLVDEIASDPSAYVILFPDESAVELKDLPVEEFSKIRNVIVIDGTWSQAAAINRTDPYCKLRRIKINPDLKTVFWRYQDLGEHCLSTIEAIYYFMREFREAQGINEDFGVYDGRFDNLLYFFSYFYHLIQKSYNRNPDRKYTSRHRSDYIKKT